MTSEKWAGSLYHITNFTADNHVKALLPVKIQTRDVNESIVDEEFNQLNQIKLN